MRPLLLLTQRRLVNNKDMAQTFYIGSEPLTLALCERYLKERFPLALGDDARARSEH